VDTGRGTACSLMVFDDGRKTTRPNVVLHKETRDGRPRMLSVEPFIAVLKAKHGKSGG